MKRKKLDQGPLVKLQRCWTPDPQASAASLSPAQSLHQKVPKHWWQVLRVRVGGGSRQV